MAKKLGGKNVKPVESGRKVSAPKGGAERGSLSALIDPLLLAGGMTIKEIAGELATKAADAAKGKDLAANVRARTVVYLAYLLWSRAQERLSRKYPSLTVTKALKLVEDVHVVRFKAGKRNLEWTTRRSEEQERILKLVGARSLLPSG